MTQVWKYILDPYNSSVLMPSGAEILSVGEQGNDVCLWARVDPNAPKVFRDFLIVGTGHNIPENLSLKFVGTVHIFNRVLVFHIFEKCS